MNKLSTYIPSLILTVLLVLMTLASSVALLVNNNITADKAYTLTVDKNLGEVVKSELDKYYYKKYSSSGIPADVYTRFITADYVSKCEKECIDQGFYAIEYNEPLDIHLPKNQHLEDSITSFFEEYASSEGYKIDSNFYKKVDETINNAYNSVKNYTDVYKISALNEHKVLRQLSKLYSVKGILTAVSIGIEVVIILLMLLINRKSKGTVLYWTGTAGIIAGLAGIIPSCIILFNRYYDSFSIKQPAVFLAYTGAMYKFTDGFLASSIAVTVVGLCMLIIYGICHNKDKKQNVKPTLFK